MKPWCSLLSPQYDDLEVHTIVIGANNRKKIASTFIPSPNNGNIVLIVSKTKESDQDKVMH